MQYITEKFIFTKEKPFAVFITEAKQTMMHRHDCLEINMVLNGRGHYYIGDCEYELSPGDIFVINNMEHHLAVKDKELSMIVFIFDQSFVWEASEENDYLKLFYSRKHSFSNKIKTDNEVYVKIKNTIEEINRENMERQEGWQSIIKSWLKVLLGQLYRYYNLDSALVTDGSEYNNYKRIETVVEYINNNYSEGLKLEELAELAMMNKSYFSTYFSSVMGVSVFEYVEKVRMKNAKRLLRITDMTVLDIALQCGYKSNAYFDRVFKKVTGLTPFKYRKQNR